MIRNAKAGDRVQAIDPDTREPLVVGSQSYTSGGEIVGKWDYSLGNTGTIISISYKSYANGYRTHILTRPDPPNFGDFVWFTPKCLRRLAP